MEPDTQLKRARISLFDANPVQHRSASWNGFSYLEKACSRQSGQDNEGSASDDRDDVPSPAARPTRRKLDGPTLNEDEELEAMDMTMEMEDPVPSHSPETPPHWPERAAKPSSSRTKRSPCSTSSLSTCEMSDVENLPPLAESTGSSKAREISVPAGSLPPPEGPMLVKSDGKAIPLTPQLLETLATGWNVNASVLGTSAPAEVSMERVGGKRSMSGGPKVPLHSPGTPTLAMSGFSLTSPAPARPTDAQSEQDVESVHTEPRDDSALAAQLEEARGMGAGE
eukprot:CAMPEP_0202814634 /NCGR_PEP_ID=MMETSP1389-20130828/5715_1 /ASSEMBLY_ACC=CAM_ASM_000865 /TAXON_ID=302021 /ORGANISM="Rhodomonas sp., Strain CCMP768" /LENGTH=281 /DNA_ID=CAMNT_0049486443 /DNA_START=188 /DNA_END=1030 /DNA_ORIENTATION=-